MRLCVLQEEQEKAEKEDNEKSVSQNELETEEAKKLVDKLTGEEAEKGRGREREGGEIGQE